MISLKYLKLEIDIKSFDWFDLMNKINRKIRIFL